MMMSMDKSFIIIIFTIFTGIKSSHIPIYLISLIIIITTTIEKVMMMRMMFIISGLPTLSNLLIINIVKLRSLFRRGALQLSYYCIYFITIIFGVASGTEITRFAFKIFFPLQTLTKAHFNSRKRMENDFGHMFS